MLFALATFATMAQSQGTYSGKLDGRLHIDPRSLGVNIWSEATADDASKLGLSLKHGDRIFRNKLTLSSDPVIAFDAAIVRSPDGTDVLHVDLNRDERFEEDERFAFQPIDGNAPESKWQKDRVGIEVPLVSGLYRTCPIEIRLPKSNLSMPMPVGPNQIVVESSDRIFVEGYAQLPDRSLLMRFVYDFKLEAIDLNNGVEFADVNDDGKIDLTPGSPEMQMAKGKPPLFRAGNLVVSAQSVDLATNVFVLRSVSPENYHRIDLVVGSTLPDFSFTDFSGKTHHLSEVKASYILLDFWATWCEACVADLPSKIRAYKQFHARGFEILGMDGAEETIEKPQRLLDKMKISWPQARFDKELFTNELQITQWPTLVLVDAHRKIVSRGYAEHLPLYGDNLSKTLSTLFHNRP